MSKSDGAEELTASLKMLEIQQRVEHNETLPINRLPVELFCMILQYLDRSKLFAFESVCKKWAYFVKVFVRQKLVVSKENEVRPRHWFYLDDRCPPNAVAKVMVTLGLNVEPVANSFWFGLKQLKICDPFSSPYYKQPRPEWELINRLTALEVLEVSQLPIGTLSLPNLRHLAIDSVECYLMISIDCPQLLSFKTKMLARRSRNFDFNHPTSITHLYLDWYSYKDTFEQLTSLQYLSMMGFEYNVEIGEDYITSIFSTFSKLKEISLRPGGLNRNSSRSFIELLREKQALERDNVALTFCGVSIESESQLDWIHSEHRKHHKLLPKFYLENYGSLRVPELKWIQVIHYVALDFPGDFHEKFRYVREIRVNSQVKDEDHLIKFIEGFKRLEMLGVKKVAQLRESFYRKLARSSPISYLAIWLESQGGLSDLDFLFEFNHLVCFTLHTEDIGDRFVQRMFQRFESIELNYLVEEDNVKIRRPRKDAKFEFSVCHGHLEKFDQLSDLLDLIESNCRNSFDDDHQCKSSCDFMDCPNQSYTENCYKRI